MSINQEIWLSPLQWSSFHYIKDDLSNLVFGFDVQVKTKSLTVTETSDKFKFCLKLIGELYEKGMSNKEISDYLNNNGFLTPNNNAYNQKSIWGTLRQIKERENRLKNTEFFVGEKFIFIIKKSKFSNLR